MEFISKLSPSIYFGKYPDTEMAFLIAKMLKIECFIDVTLEPLPPYELPSGVKLIKFPILDGNVASDEKVLDLIESLGDEIVYIHCRGGHGRCATIAAILHSYRSKKTGEEVLQDVYVAHQNRTTMKPRWRRLGAPQTLSQKCQVLRLAN